MLKVTDVHKSFDKKEILRGVNLSIEKGEVMAVLGPSGSGKTTLLRCMNFLEKSDLGEMTFKDTKIDMKNASRKEIADYRINTAFVFQNFNLFINKTALENVTEGLIIARKMKKDEANKIGMEALTKVGLADKASSYPTQLSGGQQQRVAIARAIASNPDIIFFDEPTSALDPELINEVLDVIKNLAQDGMTMIIVTHEVRFARNVATRIVFMDEGEIISSLPTEEFFANNESERIKNFLNSIERKD